MSSSVFPDQYCGHMKTICAILVYIQQLPKEITSNYSIDNDELIDSYIDNFTQYLKEGVEQIVRTRSAAGATASSTEGAEVVKKSTNTTQLDVDFVNNCLNFYRRYNHLITSCFQSHSSMKLALSNAIVSLMNSEITCAQEKDNTTPTDMLASFIDRLLKKDNKEKSTTETELDNMLTECVFLFKHIRDKDVFIEIYKDLLGKRLLNNKSASIDDEKNALVKIKVLQGANFTSKVEGMINDMGTAEVGNKEFHVATGDMYLVSCYFIVLIFGFYKVCYIACIMYKIIKL